jgi:hypothetical protein
MKTMPAVVNGRDCSGHEVPAGTVYIGRRVTQGGYRLVTSKWANPFNIPNNAALEQRELWPPCSTCCHAWPWRERGGVVEDSWNSTVEDPWSFRGTFV